MVDAGELIRAARERRGLSQGQLAYLANVAREEICRWESGRHTILSDSFLRILTKLHFRLVLHDYEQSSLNATRTIEAICQDLPSAEVVRRLEALDRDELVQVTAWLWLKCKTRPPEFGDREKEAFRLANGDVLV